MIGAAKTLSVDLSGYQALESFALGRLNCEMLQ